MRILRFDRVASFCVGGILCIVSPPCGAQEFQNSQLQTYRDLRGAMLAEGWKPDVNYGLRLASGKPLYRFPEVICGPQICNARWLSRRGEEKLVTLLRGDGKEEYRVAPR